MSIRVALHHRTAYRFDRSVSLGPHVIRLRPAPHCRTRIESYSLTIEPDEHFLNWQQDPQGNHVARAVFPKRARELVLQVDLVADLVAINAFDFFLDPGAERFPFPYEPALATELAAYREPGEAAAGPLLDAFLEEFRRHEVWRSEGGPRTIDLVVALNRGVKDRVSYLIRMEPGVQRPEDTLRLGSGSCRDSAWLIVGLLRRLGLAARFCSGYLVQLVPDEKPLEGPAGPAADFIDLHAWAEVYLPGAGWVGLDPTSGLLAAEGHIPLAATTEPVNAAPVTGAVDPCGTTFDVVMQVTRLADEPRTTRPLADDQWRRIEALGDEVDAALAAGDVRLTCGGEPTYVSIDDFDSAEWNTAATGPEKWTKAGRLARRLLDALGPGGLLMERQGKWYPGEPLPRWALELFWRPDGAAIWNRRDLLADGQPRAPVPAAVAGRFLAALAPRLGLAPADVMAAHEVRGLAGAAAAAPDRPPVAFILPVLRHEPAGRPPVWRTSRWPFSDGVPLVPGDSPAGLRLPLASLPWPDEAGLRAGTSIVRTALVTEVRGGRLHVFLPPLEPVGTGAAADDFLELIAQVEATAEELATPVVLEGYAPPGDDRIGSLQVTPDPGVIEVNVPPVATWRDLVRVRTVLDREARGCRLGAEKFEIDGLHTGTGGGDHIVLGGATPADSPFLRRPGLLARLVAYWNNHPSLSYLFSGRFIGPTSQAPRIDEARHESLYELEIALAELAAAGADTPAWFVDRVFRNLLVDMTGNTHRTEFCIDKLYSPDSAGGRRGLVELRAFEMAPHVRMSLLVQLLVRALVAWHWREAAVAGSAPPRLVRWGTSLHDRFLLPHFLMLDFHGVLDDLRRAGFAFEREWFSCFEEFRFPRLGTVTVDGVRLSLRAALEPWHVLGEQPVGGATARLVDSSLDRVQLQVAGLVPGRHVVACNGRRVPLVPTGMAGESVAGVRFRAWRPPQCLHPTIPIHSPLVFDVIDAWSGRSLGGCTWHVVHPGGRSFATRPVNALEAESRRAARFFASGHTPGPIDLPAEESNAEYPCTLDLRRR